MIRKIKKTLSGQRGFTLVEAMVSLVIAVIVGASFYYLYNHQHKQYISEQNMSELQANTRFILESMSKDLIMAGYRPVNTPGISEASDNKMVFEYWDEKASVTSPNDRHRQITFWVDSSDSKNPLKRRVQQYNPTAGVESYNGGQSYVIGEHIDNLAFEYYDNQNNKIDPAPGTTASDLEKIRSFKVTVKVRSIEQDPFTIPPDYKYMTLSRTYQARNLGIAGSPVDITPPIAPTSVESIDPGICGELNLRWNANSEPDLAGYYIYYGQESGSYVEKIKIGNPATNTYTLTGLTSTKSTDATPVIYYIAMTAFDNSANTGPFSTEISGNPSPSVDDFNDVASKGNDTTINPPIPYPPANFDAGDGAGEGAVLLTWTISISTDVVEYRLHRSKTAGFTPSGETAGAGNCIAVLNPGDVSYLDSSLIGCTTYYYKIASVNCDETLVPTYSAAEYSYCFGDGPLTDIAMDMPTQNVTDSTPTDNTPIDDIPLPVPQISSYAGWKRVFISLTNPNLTDDPDFAFTNIYFNKGASGYPTVAPGTCNVTNGTLVPDNGGSFIAPGSGTSFKHDSETEIEPSQPSLENLVTYFYLAVAYDQCGNCTSVTEQATTLSELCGDDPPGLPQCDPSIMLNPTVEGCGGYSLLSWDGDCLKDGSSLNRDFSGFHLFRNEGETYNSSDPTHIELTGGVPQWFQTYTDASMAEGKFYSYAVEWADCAYEHENMGNISDPFLDGGLVEGVSIGRLDEADSNIVITGDLTISPPTYEHEIVTFYLKNTSAGPMTISSLSLRWDNPLSYLAKIVIGDDSTTARETVWESASLPLSMGAAGGTLTFVKSIDGLDTDVPLKLYFANQNGSVDYNCDMREDSLIMEVTYTNDTTGTETCGVTGTIPVPLGPAVTRTNQNKPFMATLSWPVPGYGGTNTKDRIIVPGAVSVTVNTFVQDFSGSGISAVNLYYYVDDSLSLSEGPDYDGSNYTEVPMTPVSGNLWKLEPGNEIPAYDDSSVWFFIVAVDNEGNFDRDPEVRAGAFQYYQQQADVCTNVPEPPSLSGETFAGQVVLTWVKPSLNTDSSSCTDIEGYKVYRYDGVSWTLLTTVTDSETTTYSDTPPTIDTVNYSYYVSAYDTCTPANESAASNIYAECAGAPPCLLSVQLSSNPFIAGDSFSINLSVCDRINGMPNEIIYAQTCSSTLDAHPIALLESGDTGNFSIDPSYGRTSVITYLTADYPASEIDLDLEVSETDNITVGVYSDLPYSDVVCSVSYDCDSTTIPVVPEPVDPCLAPEPPGAPQNLVATRTKTGCSAASNDVILTWDAPSTGLVSFYRVYRCSGSGCAPGGSPIAQSSATTLIDSPPGKLDNIYRYHVTAVNNTCPTAPQEGLASSVVQQCP